MKGIFQTSMKFTQQLELLKEQYKNNLIIRKNGTLNLGPGIGPGLELHCDHQLFKPLTEALIDKFLRADYKWPFPKEYAEFLKYSNGASLCRVRLKGKATFTSTLFHIYGLPRTQPFGRPFDEEEPGDVRIESLSYHKDLPDYWLKCARYTKNYDFYVPYEVFIDTKTNQVHEVAKDSAIVTNTWDALDECFCYIWDSLKDRKSEYDFGPKGQTTY